MGLCIIEKLIVDNLRIGNSKVLVKLANKYFHKYS